MQNSWVSLRGAGDPFRAPLRIPTRSPAQRTLAPIWLPHCPACRCTISRMVVVLLEAAVHGVDGPRCSGDGGGGCAALGLRSGSSISRELSPRHRRVARVLRLLGLPKTL